jgi:hypothetical protein
MRAEETKTMDIQRIRTDDDRASQSSSGGTTVPEPERPSTPPTAPGRSADAQAYRKPGSAPVSSRTSTPPTASASPADTAGATVTTGTTGTEPRVGTSGPATAEEIDRLSRRMERALGGFVDDPRRAVREADAVLDEASRRLVRMLEERRSSLRESWQGDNGVKGGTEELRVALTKYRDMTRELLNVS